MSQKNKFKKNKKFVLIFSVYFVLLANFLFFENIFAEVMSSSNYKIQSDSINFGGSYSDSSNYKIEDTLGEIATGESGSVSYRLKAGYQQMQEVYLSMTAVDNVVLLPPISGITGGAAFGTTSVVVTTDSPSGYELSIKASSSPALVSGANSFSDYSPIGSDPDMNFNPPTISVFGFNPFGSDVSQRYKNDGVSCNTGSNSNENYCWDGLSTSEKIISSRSTGNHPNGVETSIKFRAEIASGANQPEGSYTATTTLTLLPT